MEILARMYWPVKNYFNPVKAQQMCKLYWLEFSFTLQANPCVFIITANPGKMTVASIVFISHLCPVLFDFSARQPFSLGGFSILMPVTAACTS